MLQGALFAVRPGLTTRMTYERLIRAGDNPAMTRNVSCSILKRCFRYTDSR